ncbi:hypothetical protein DH2020_015331 [Rehmannia glutinosa]|uniref:Uncharacterized protein n=1 Tax=Rehmannia glutinosa TaxID=99300 RepID=A0ABR0WTD2_REHGL
MATNLPNNGGNNASVELGGESHEYRTGNGWNHEYQISTKFAEGLTLYNRHSPAEGRIGLIHTIIIWSLGAPKSYLAVGKNIYIGTLDSQILIKTGFIENRKYPSRPVWVTPSGDLRHVGQIWVLLSPICGNEHVVKFISKLGMSPTNCFISILCILLDITIVGPKGVSVRFRKGALNQWLEFVDWPDAETLLELD